MRKEWLGACFTVSKHLIEADLKLELQRITVDLLPHYFVKNGNQIIDLTASQFNHKIDYSKARNPGKWWK